MSFSGFQDVSATWSTRFGAFNQRKDLHDTLMGTKEFLEAPPRFGKKASAADRKEHWRLTKGREAALVESEKRKNQIWCYLAITLNSSSLMLIRHKCVDEKGLCDGQGA